MGGKTDDNFEELDGVTYDGERLKVGQDFIRSSESCGDSRPRKPALSEPEVRGGVEGSSGAGSSGRGSSARADQIHNSLKQIADEYADLIRSKFPNIPRRVSGYNLNYLLPENSFHIARALVGSEGTCATVLE